MAYITGKGFLIDISKVAESYNTVFMEGGNIIDTDNNKVIAVPPSKTLVSSGINKIYYDISTQTVLASLTEKGSGFVKLHEIEVDSDMNLIGSVKVERTITEIPSPVSYTTAVDNTLGVELAEAVEEMDIKLDVKLNETTALMTQQFDGIVLDLATKLEDALAEIETIKNSSVDYVDNHAATVINDNVIETLQETRIVQTDTITTAKDVKSINSIYVEELGFIDLTTSINTIENKSIVLGDVSLDGLTVVVSYNFLTQTGV